MNAPDRFELLILPDGVSKVAAVDDLKIPNAASFTIEREDHTVGNLIRYALLKNPKVLFAGYRVPHPLVHNVVIKIQTTADYTPRQAFIDAVQELMRDLKNLKKNFQMEAQTSVGRDAASRADAMQYTSIDADADQADVDF